MLDVEDFETVFHDLNYDESLLTQIHDAQHALGGRTFFERLLDLLKIKVPRRSYPPKAAQQLRALHQAITTSPTTLHNKHCLLYYLLKDLSSSPPNLSNNTSHSRRSHSAESERATTFLLETHLEPRFRTFIDGLWALDHLALHAAVGFLTHPSLTPTFPDEIIYALLRIPHERRTEPSHMDEEPLDMLPLAYFDCVGPPLADPKVRDEFAKYLVDRNVPAAYEWMRSRPAHEREALLEILLEQTLDKHIFLSGSAPYSREEKAMDLVALPFTREDEAFVERFLTEGRGRTFLNAEDTVAVRRLARGKMDDILGDVGGRGRRVDGVSWEGVREGVRRGVGGRKGETIGA